VSGPGALAAGQRIADRYELGRRIAVGGMGEVWEASDIRLGRDVAVKVLRPELSDDPEFLHRFRVEARTVASLNHSGVASIHDYGEDDAPQENRRTAYLVMELVRGEPLSARIARGPIDTEETLRIVEQAAHALHAAHERGYVHRDVKPGNILLRVDGTVKLTDFGIAKAANAVPVTRSGMVMGTAHYIAPEQASGGEAGPEGDVYSLGIVGYECLAGHRPFRADNAVAVAMMQVRDEPPPLPDTVPEHVRSLIAAVLVKDPARRYADGEEFAAAVAAVRRGEGPPVPVRISGASGSTPASPASGPVATVSPSTRRPAGSRPGTDGPDTGARAVDRAERKRSRRAEKAARRRKDEKERAAGSAPAVPERQEPAPDRRTDLRRPAVETSAARAPSATRTATPPPAEPVAEPSVDTGGRHAVENAAVRAPDDAGDTLAEPGTTGPRSGPGAVASPAASSSGTAASAAPPTPAPRTPAPRTPAPRTPAPPTPAPPTPPGWGAHADPPRTSGPPTGPGARPGTPAHSIPHVARITDRPPVPPAPPTEPLRLVPSSRGTSSVLVVLFVVVLLAAIALAVFAVPRLFDEADGTPTTSGLPGSVSSRVAVLAGSAVADPPARRFVAAIDPGEAR
jgi:serine/threonine protein kinase